MLVARVPETREMNERFLGRPLDNPRSSHASIQTRCARLSRRPGFSRPQRAALHDLAFAVGGDLTTEIVYEAFASAASEQEVIVAVAASLDRLRVSDQKFVK